MATLAIDQQIKFIYWQLVICTFCISFYTVTIPICNKKKYQIHSIAPSFQIPRELPVFPSKYSQSKSGQQVLVLDTSKSQNITALYLQNSLRAPSASIVTICRPRKLQIPGLLKMVKRPDKIVKERWNQKGKCRSWEKATQRMLHAKGS